MLCDGFFSHLVEKESAVGRCTQATVLFVPDFEKIHFLLEIRPSYSVYEIVS